MQLSWLANNDKTIAAVALGILSAAVAIALLGLPWIWIILLVSVLPLTALAFYVGDLRKFSFYLFVFLLPLAFQKIIYNPVSTQIILKPVLVFSISDIPLIFFIGITFIRLLKVKHRIDVKNKIAILWFSAWLLWCFVSLFNSITIPHGVQFSFIMLIYLIKIFLLFICLSYVPFDNKTLRTVSFIIIASVFIQSCFVLIQHFSSTTFGIIGVESIAMTFSTSMQSAYTRSSGTMGHVNAEATFFSLMIPLVFTFFMFAKRFTRILLTGIIFLLASLSLVFTFSRGGWGATFLAILFCMVFIFVKSLSADKWIKTIFLILCVVLALGFYLRPIVDRITLSDNGAAASRGRLVDTALKMFIDHPVIGVGINNYQEVAPEYGFSPKGAGFYKHGRLFVGTAPVHNRFLLTLTETGIIGFVFFMGFILTVLIFGFRYVLAVKSDNVPIAIAMFSAFAGSLFYMQIEIFCDPTILTMLFLAIALLYNCYNNDKSNFYKDNGIIKDV